MRFASGTVLGLATLVASRALYQALVTHEMPLDVALARYLISAVAVWAGLGAVAFLIGPTGSETRTGPPSTVSGAAGVAADEPTDLGPSTATTPQ